MFRELRVRGLGVIDDVTLDLDEGLTVVTGETGVGKTLIVTGLSLLCGARADMSLVRDGADAALIEAMVDGDGDEEVVSRRIASAGNRIRVGGQLGTVADLGAWADGRVEIHGQHEHLRLGKPAVQRRLLDHFADPGHLEVLARHQKLWDERAHARAERDVLAGDERIRLRLAEQLRHELDEIESAVIDPDRDAALEERLVVMEAGEHVVDALVVAANALGEDGALEPVGAAVGALRGLPSAPELDQLADRGLALAEELADLARDLRDAAEEADVDPDALEEARERARLLASLQRKYGDDLGAVLAHADDARTRLAEIDGHDDRIRELDRRLADLEGELADAAEQLLAGRRAAAGRLCPDVTERLGPLGMPHARFDIAVEPSDPSRDGGHDVTFRVSVNPGEQAVTLGKGASGGERSRIALAVETALADATEATTIVFDEVDAGVGGATAMAVGASLAELAAARSDRQVLCVTHLAQVAAHADVHHVVTKSVVDGRTVTTARRLDDDERAAELARMMGGADTGAALEHASELLRAARDPAGRGIGQGH